MAQSRSRPCSFWNRHILRHISARLQRSQELHHIRLPGPAPGHLPRSSAIQRRQCPLLGREIGLRVDVGGVERHLAEPGSDRVDVDGRLERMRSGRMANDVRADPLAVLPAVQNHTEYGDTLLGWGRAPFEALLFFRLWGSERLIVAFGVVVVVICAGVQMLFAADFEQLFAVVSADFFSEIVEEFEYREGLLRGPVGRDFEVDGEWQAVPGVGLFGGHVLAPRR